MHLCGGTVTELNNVDAGGLICRCLLHLVAMGMDGRGVVTDDVGLRSHAHRLWAQGVAMRIVNACRMW